jgi:hypothetical protein
LSRDDSYVLYEYACHDGNYASASFAQPGPPNSEAVSNCQPTSWYDVEPDENRTRQPGAVAISHFAA